jgi:hypothetical protein
MSDNFQFSQGSFSENGEDIQYARLSVPGLGRNEKENAPVILIEINHKSGEVVLEVYGDINSKVATHEIPLNGAKITAKKAAVNG